MVRPDVTTNIIRINVCFDIAAQLDDQYDRIVPMGHVWDTTHRQQVRLILEESISDLVDKVFRSSKRVDKAEPDVYFKLPCGDRQRILVPFFLYKNA